MLPPQIVARGSHSSSCPRISGYANHGVRVPGPRVPTIVVIGSKEDTDHAKIRFIAKQSASITYLT